MAYPEQFRDYREARNLTREELADKAGCHRNTVINVESGRPVKFQTVAGLMEHMGYARTSAETKLLALLWLESVSGIALAPSEAQTLRGASTRDASRDEVDELLAGLRREELDLIEFAARHQEVLQILRAIRTLLRGSATKR
jgi:transcriptional regulator with XRE-family HTH domain